MRIGAILPHVQKFGGCRRYLELGNCLIKRGINFTIFAKKPNCDWFDFKGKIRGWKDIEADYILCGDPPSFGILKETKGKIFIWVQAGGGYIEGSKWAKGGYRSVYGKYPFLVNSRVFLKYFPKAHLVEGGINTEFFKPLKNKIENIKPKVLFYDRKSKGAEYVKKELANLHTIELINFQNLNNNKLLKLYQSGDFFISWESREGWPNTAAEALACGLIVVGNGFNCQPFIDGIIVVQKLRQFFMDSDNLKIRRKYYSMERFSWDRIADKLLELFAQSHKEQRREHHHIHK